MKMRLKKYDEDKLKQALNEIRSGKISKKKAALTYNIPRSTLQFRLKHATESEKESFKRGPKTILTKEEEEKIVKWLIENHKKGFPRKKEDLLWAVAEFLNSSNRVNPFKNKTPGRSWCEGFLKRHPEVIFGIPEAITATSTKVSIPNINNNWFIQTENYLKEENLLDILLDPTRIFNCDETNFQLCPKNEMVLAPTVAKNLHEVDDGVAKSSITVMFTSSASGELTPPIIIYPYKRIPENVIVTCPSHWKLFTSDNGLMTKDIFHEYIGNIFHNYLLENNVKFPIILFVDGQITNLTLKLSELCREKNIILIAQPTAVSTFKPLNTAWRKSVLKYRHNNPGKGVTKKNFAPFLKRVLECDYISKEVIRNGFRTCGLFPFNGNTIDYLQSLRNDSSESNEQEEKFLTYEDFKKIVGQDIITKFECFQNSVEMDENRRILYNIFRFFKEENIDDILSSSTAQTVHCSKFENIETCDESQN